MRILICDDEPHIADTIAEHLEACGHRCIVRHSAGEALRVLDAEPEAIGLVITDLCMPDRDGLRLTDGVRERGLTMPVALMTAHPLPGSNERLAERGVSVVLRKPLHLTDLEAIAASARTLHRMRQTP
jgi:two-component system capsular synthesis sensor histidine kinase RcsC